jgi:hypothetical protein
MSKILSEDLKALVRTDSSNLERLIKLPDLFPNTRWVGGYAIGQGSFGLATLWVLVDNLTLIYTGIYLQLKNKGLDFGADPLHPVGQAAPHLRFLKEAYLQGLMTVPNVTEEMYAVPLHG